MTMQLVGQGMPAREQGVAPGNVIVNFQIREDPRFVRDNGDLVHEHKIGIEVAALGGQITVPTLDGDVNVRVLPGCQPGDRLVLKGRGLPIIGMGFGVGAHSPLLALRPRVRSSPRCPPAAPHVLHPAPSTSLTQPGPPPLTFRLLRQGAWWTRESSATLSFC